MSYAVHVSNIAPATSKAALTDFFTFCGKITSIDFNETATPKTATIHFEKPTAVKTALMLNGGTLDGEHLTVSSEKEHPEETPAPWTEGTPIGQTDKPRAAIAAEYLAKGYVLSDSILQRAIELDNQHGISSTFLSYWNSFDKAAGSKVSKDGAPLSSVVTGHVNTATGIAATKAKELDQQHGVSAKGGDYYSKAIASPYAQNVRTFYTTTTKQLLDIHEEAKRIAAQNAPNSPTFATHAASTGTPAPATHAAIGTANTPATAVPVHTENAPTVV